MGWMKCSADVHGGDDGEYECLNQRHEDLECGEGHEAAEGEDFKDVHPARCDRDTQDRKGDEQDVASEHVCKQTNGVAERAKDEGREQLDCPHERTKRKRNARWPRDVFEVRDAVVLHTDGDEHRPRNECNNNRSTHPSVGWHLEERDDLGDVPEEDKQEERDEQWQVGQTIWTNRRQYDLLLDKLNDRLGHGANARWNEALLLSSQHEHDRRDDHREHMRQCDLVKADSIDDWLLLDQVGQ